MCDVFERAIDHWRATGASVRPPASESEIEDTFATLNFPLTDEVRQWYLLADGFEHIDEYSSFWWWSLERIRKENQHPHRDSNRLWFADFLIDSHRCCFTPSTSTFSEVWIDFDPNDRLGDPSLIVRLGDQLLTLLGSAQHLSQDSGDERYQLSVVNVAEFLEKYLHNPEDVSVFIA